MFLKSGLISRFGVMRTMMALLAIAMSLIGLTVVGLSLGMGMVLYASLGLAGAVVVLQFHEVGTVKSTVLASFVSVATVALAYTVLGASVITMAEVGLYALITAISMATAVWTFSGKRAITKRANASPTVRAIDNVGKMKSHRPSATVTHIGKHHHPGVLAA